MSIRQFVLAVLLWIQVLFTCDLVASVDAEKRILHGTTIAVVYSQDEIIFATDSGGVQDMKTRTDAVHKFCKIKALGKSAMLTVSGYAGYCDAGATNCSDDPYALGQNLFDKLATSASDIAEQLTAQWGEAVNEIIKKRLNTSKSLMSTPSSRALIQAVFAIVDKQGKMHLSTTQIVRDDPIAFPTKTRVDGPRIKPLEIPKAGEWNILPGISSGWSIISEFLEGKTARSMVEQKNWPAKVINRTASASQMEEFAVHLVELSIDNYPITLGEPKEVDYPINAARLTKAGFSWIKPPDCK